jgi:Rrf2 family protein
MRVSARADYAVRAAAELAAAEPRPLTRDRVAELQDVPVRYLENILVELKHRGIVRSVRGTGGGYLLARPSDQITVAEVVLAVDGPLADVHGHRPDSVEYSGSAKLLRDVWIAMSTSLRIVLDQVALADLVTGTLPSDVQRLASPTTLRFPR